MSGGFTKLVPEIVLSSIWNESAEVRCVWIAMLATKDQDGNVRGNPQSLARLANVPISAVVEALAKFQAPDHDSNTPDNDGRRIQAVPGGWHVLNHEIYKGRDYREAEAERKREYRKTHKMSGTCPGQVPDSSVSVSVSVSSSESVSGKGIQGETTDKPAKQSVELPFDTPAFIESWKGYVDHRRRLRKPMTDRAQRLALSKLPASEAEAIRWVDNAVQMGWQGIFEPKEATAPRKPAKPHEPTREELHEANVSKLVSKGAEALRRMIAEKTDIIWRHEGTENDWRAEQAREEIADAKEALARIEGKDGAE